MIITNASLLHLGCRIITLRQWTKAGLYWLSSDHLKLKLAERLVYRPFTNSTRKANMCLLGKKDRFNAITVDLANWENKDFISDVCAFSKTLSGLVLNEDKREVLMIQDKHRIVRWKFPGGLSHFQEDIPDTAMREVLEETGIKTEFQSVLCFRQQHNMPWTFGISDIYVICRLRPLNFDINMCPEELIDAKWMKIEELLHNTNHTHLAIRVAHLVQHGLSNGFDTVDMTMEELPSVYKNATYKLFHKPIPLS